jgi:hypothetical protein
LKPFYASVVLIGLLLTLSGCPKHKPAAAPEDRALAKRSYAIQVRCFDREFTVKAAPEKVFAFLTDPDNWGGDSRGSGRLEEPLIGNSFPFSVDTGGGRTAGRMVVIKSGPQDLWYLWANPRALHIERWKFAGGGNETMVTLAVETELGNGGPGPAELCARLARRLDQVVAALRARFDASLNLEDLVAAGPGYEPYDSVIQAYEVVQWLDAPPGKVMEYGLDPRNVEALGGMKYDQARVTRHGIGYAPLSTQLLGMQIKLDSFFLDRSKEENMFVTYFVVRDWAGFTKTIADPEAGGSRTHQIVAIEIPGASNNAIELMYTLTGVPGRLEQSMTKLKANVEAP